MTYLTVIHKSKYGYDIRVPALPGCHSQGKSKKEVLTNIQDAILAYLFMSHDDLKGSEIREVKVSLPS